MVVDNHSDVGTAMLLTPLWGRDGGVAAHVQASAAALADRGWDVHVLAARIASDERFDGVTLHHRPALLDRGASADERLGEHASFEPTVTHLHQVDDLGVVEHLRRNAPVLISAHGYPGCTSGVYFFSPGQECTRAHGPGCIPNLVARGCAHTRHPRTLPKKYLNVTRGLAALRRADLAICYSNAVERHLAANGLERRAVIPYFPTMPVKQGAEHAATRRVVFAGRLERPKGVGVLIRAAHEVDGEFVICGEGRELELLRRLAGRLGVEGKLRFAGWLDPDQLASELAAASVLVVPSLWPEPFGIVGIEALASGRPAVASATGGIVDWLQDGVGGLTVKPGDPHALAQALNELLADPQRRTAMGIAGRELVAERFSRERHVATLLDAYRQARSTWQAERS